MCLERKDGEPVRALYVRQNVTELKQKELREQRERAVLNRKDKQYRIAIMSNSFSTFECNLTKDRIEQDITCGEEGTRFHCSNWQDCRLPARPPCASRNGNSLC